MQRALGRYPKDFGGVIPRFSRRTPVAYMCEERVEYISRNGATNAVLLVLWTNLSAIAGAITIVVVRTPTEAVLAIDSRQLFKARIS